MNDFLEQFLIEARELVDQATSDLLALENRPEDKDRHDSAFRAMHTLKGAAAIVEFEAMGRAMHVAEDVLSNVRAGNDVVTPQLIGNCLTVLDQVAQWLDAIEVSGDLPLKADTQADAILARFGGTDKAEVATVLPDAKIDDWIAAILEQYPDAAQAAHVVVRFMPDPDCFFKGNDPLAFMANVAGLLALNVAGKNGWPAIDDFDLFQCQMVITALLTSSPGDVAKHFETVTDQVEIIDLKKPGPKADLLPSARAIIEAQIHLLSEMAADGLSGRLASARQVAASVMRASDREEDVAKIEHAAMQSLAEGDSENLIAILQQVLADRSETGKEATATPPDARGDGLDTVTRVRVDVERIDKLVKLVGELTVVKNYIVHIAELAEIESERSIAGPLKEHSLQLERLLSQVQINVLSLRVLPLRNVFQRFPKLVREIVSSLGKSARFLMEGEATEADKSIIESIFDPLLHVIRNAVDHGIETEAERAAQGKPCQATIILRGGRQGDNLIIEVEDDGRGVNVERVREVALTRGVATAEALASMSEPEIIGLVFEPGFSTASHITDLSGRGVGMDVVRTVINRLGGCVHIESIKGHGAKVRFTLPFSIMLTQIITVEANGQIFGIPLDFVAETLHLPRGQIMPLGSGYAFVSRDRTIPLLRLRDCLGLETEEKLASTCTIVVTKADGALAGLEVDRIGGRMNVLFQPMEGLLSDMAGITGTTLLGDGRVLLILDIEDLLS